MIYEAAEVEVDKRNRGAGFSLGVDWCFFGGVIDIMGETEYYFLWNNLIWLLTILQ